MNCGKCSFHQHDETNKQDVKMLELGYKPCTKATTLGAFYHKNFIKCEKFRLNPADRQKLEKELESI